jgi:cyclophilin family peptidyl-prolyl cis-trans isomerase
MGLSSCLAPVLFSGWHPTFGQGTSGGAEHAHDHDHAHGHGHSHGPAMSGGPASRQIILPEARSPEEEGAQERLRTAEEKLREVLKDLTRQFLTHHTARGPVPSGQREEWLATHETARLIRLDWLTAASELVAIDVPGYQNLLLLLGRELDQDVRLDRYDGLLPIIKNLVGTGVRDPQLYLQALLVAWADSDLDLVEQWWQQSGLTAESSPMAALIARQAELSRDKWERELRMRQEDAARDDLPRVLFRTTKGDFVFELFEDSAPNSVANFIYLCEQNFFRDLAFFRVIEQVVAQTGCPRNDGSGDSGYTVASERNHPDRRHHFRGSLGIALGNVPDSKLPDQDSGSSQFYICAIPLPNLDDDFTVFGRVIEGLEHVGYLQKVDPSDDEKKKEVEDRLDLILSVEVLRKRDHQYRPEPAAGRLPR